MSGGHRIERLNELFRRELARLLLSDIKDPRLTDVTVTQVRVSGDLSYATVYVRNDLGESAEQAIAGLEHAGGFIRRELGRSLHLRKIPEFRFEIDDTFEHARRIEELLRQTREEGAEGAG